MKKRFLTMLLALVMVFSLFPTTALAGWGYGAGKHSTGKREPETPTVTWTGNRWTGTSGLEVKVTGADLKGKTLSVEKLGEEEAAQYFAAIEAAGVTLVDPIALDIKLKNGWKDYQPTGEVQVSITRSGVTLSDTVYHFADAEEEADEGAEEEVQPSIKAAPGLRGTLSSVGEDNVSGDVYEVDDDTDASVVPALKFETLTSSTSGETVTVTTNHFSVYVVGETVKENRVKVIFKNGDFETSMYVKSDDIIEATGAIDATVLYDPGVGTLGDHEIFLGWTTKQQFVEADKDTGLDIDSVRTAVAEVFPVDKDADEGGTTVIYYAMVYKAYKVTYLDDMGSVARNDVLLIPAYTNDPVYKGDPVTAGGETSYPGYTVQAPYTPDSTHNFAGWLTEDGSNIELQNEDGKTTDVVNGEPVDLYLDGVANIWVKGDITFTVDAQEGHWLTFDENGKGATYCAPQFVKSGNTPGGQPRPDEEMLRPGYTFVGWYETKYADSEDVPAGVEKYDFTKELTENKIVYAKWTVKATASYTVIIYRENLTGTGYDLYESVVIENAAVDSTFTEVVQSADGTYVAVNGEAMQYTGFRLRETEPITYSSETVDAESDSIVKVYYDRRTYTLTFQVQGSNHYEYFPDDNGAYGYVDGQPVELNLTTYYTYGAGTRYNGQYYYRQATDNSGTQYGIVNGQVVQLNRQGGIGNRYWTYNNERYNGTRYYRQGYYSNTYNLGFVDGAMVQLTPATEVTYGGEPYTGQRYSRQYTSWTTIKTITAKYQAPINDQFPIVGTNGVTYNKGERWYPQDSSLFDNVIVSLETMPAENIVFHLDDNDRNTVRMKYYLEASAEEIASDEITKYEHGGKQYTLYKTDYVKLGWVQKDLDWVDINGFDKETSNPTFGAASNAKIYAGGNNNPQLPREYDSTQGGYVYYIDFYYTRSLYNIVFQDGVYVDGNNQLIAGDDKPTSMGLIGGVEDVAYGTSLASYADTKPADIAYNESYTDPTGFVFEGWYADEACNQVYDFTEHTMPNNPVVVYAKWRQIQYRVFLHPNVPETDDTLIWGEFAEGQSQAMNFRVTYGTKVSAPTGIRKGYEFGGWFTDAALTQPFNAGITNLTEQTVTTPYDKNDPANYTDNINDYGLVESDSPTAPGTDGPGYNSDAWSYNKETGEFTERDRFWITEKLDLYGLWRKSADGAAGIGLEYSLTDPEQNVTAEGTVVDDNYYQDHTEAVAQPAVTAPAGYTFEYWVVQTYDYTEGDYVDTTLTVNPGTTFQVLMDNAMILVKSWVNPKNSADIVPDPRPDTPVKDPTAPDNTHTKINDAVYTVRLRAKYKRAENAVPTFIPWFKNDGTNYFRIDGKYGDLNGYNGGKQALMINEGIDLSTVAIPTRDGYTFLGWAFVNMGNTADDAATFMTTNTSWTQNDLTPDVYYKAADNKYYTGADFAKEAKQVAADEEMPYQAVFAVWQEQYFYVFHSSTGKLEAVSLVDVPTAGYDLTAEAKENGKLYGGYFATCGGVTTENVEAAKAVAQKDPNKLAAVTGAVIYDGTRLTANGRRFWTKSDAGKVLRGEEPVDMGMGTAVKPQENDVFFVKEVPTCYLKTNARWIYDQYGDNEIYTIYLLTGIDESLYAEAGFMVGTEKTSASIVSTFSYKNRNSTTTNKVTASTLIGQRGYLGVVTTDTSFINSIVSGDVSVKPYWVTLDNVTITTAGYTFSINGGGNVLTNNNISYAPNNN